MSFSICRIAKVKAGGVTGIQIHDRREKESVSHTNKDIDWSKTHENVDLLNQQARFRTVISNRIAELNLPKALRKDATVMTQCLVTSDSVFFEEMSRAEQTDYFRKSLDFIEKRYGKENMVSATIHYDEKTPHMHVNFVPVTTDGRLSARDLFSPAKLRKLQDDYNRTCRENGYDLQRGELHSQKEHLSVEEYKVSTRYDELKAKQVELERLEGIDKKASLQAEKGRLTYSTKEVEAIKDQNSALKVDGYRKDREIDNLKHEVSRLQNGSSKLQSNLKDTKVPLERLKDLVSENRELQGYIEKRPELKKDMASFERQKKNAYDYGNAMANQKNKWFEANEERRKSIEQTYKLDKGVKECDSSIADLKDKKEQLNVTQGRIEGLEGQLEQIKGLFKGKDRKTLQEKIESEKASLKQQTDRLKADYNIEPSEIDRKVEAIDNWKCDLSHQKVAQVESTNQQEIIKDKAVKDYKYLKTMSEVQEPGFREISTRHEARANLPDHAERNFKIGRKDRAEILERMEEQHPNNAVKCRDLFDRQAQQEQQKAMTKTISKNIDVQER